MQGNDLAAWQVREAEIKTSLGLDDSKATTCSECGCKSPLAEYFYKARHGPMCPNCMGGSGIRDLRNLFVSLVLLGVVLSILASRNLGYVNWMPAVNVLAGFILLWLLVCLHELVHAAVAWLLGGRVYEIALGVGRTFYSTRWRGIRFAVRSGLLFGICIAVFPQKQNIRRRWMLYLAAPALVHLLIVVALLPFFDGRRFVTQVALIELLVVINAIDVFINLFPQKFTAIIASDGYHLWQILRAKRSADDLHAMYFMVDAFYAMEYEDFPALLTAAENALALYPNNESLPNLHATALLANERHDEALAYFETALAAPSATALSANRAMLLSNRAMAIYLLDLNVGGMDAERMASAHTSIAEAFFLLPWLTAIRVARGISCYFQGYPQAAYTLLQEALALQEKDTSRAGVLAYMALAKHAQGENQAASELFSQARRLHIKESKHLDRIQLLLDIPTSSAPISEASEAP